MCPICSIGVVAGLGLSRWLKVDDSVSGLWVGALILGISLWAFNLPRLKRRGWLALIFILIIFWLFTFLPLYYFGVIDNSCKTIWGLNRLVFGSLLGIILSSAAFLIKRGLFPYQRIIIPLSVLIIAGFILNSVCK